MASRGRHRPSCRGASAVEYALGAAFLAAALVGGLSAVSAEADRGYDDRQALIAVPVTDGNVVVTTPMTAGPSTTATLPPTSTTTTAPPAVPHHAVAASASATEANGGHWTATVTVTVTPSPASGSVSGTYVVDDGAALSFGCTLSGGTCAFTTGTLNKNHDERATFTVTGLTVTPSGTSNLPVAASAVNP